ncbi:periplasmic binding protein [hydrocarbon metagenome]|uniref:Periplasmic binding protein n=1 Tax=hydrocarbon metagenome TaxID=938273 RepID=A0A0W8F455_9ZZZZ
MGAPSLSDLHDAAVHYPRYPRRITDTAGTGFTFYRPIERVVVMHANAAESIVALGGDDRIVGVGATINTNTLQFPELSRLPGVGRWTEPDIEAILALNPDLILTYVSWPEPEKLERHLPSRIPVVRMEYYKAEVFRDEMVTTGRIFDEEENLDEYLAWYDANLDLVEGRVSTIPYEERVRVYAESGSGQSFGRRAYSEGTGLHDLLIAAGGVNVAEGHVTGYADVENEWVMHQNPDVILIWSGKAGYKLDERAEIVDLYKEIVSTPGFDRIQAVRDNRVYIVTSGYAFGTGSPAALVRVASWLYPDLFTDVDPDEIHAEYLERFTRTGREIRESGTFYFPDGRGNE